MFERNFITTILVILIFTTSKSLISSLKIDADLLRQRGFTNQSVVLNLIYTGVSELDENAFGELTNLRLIDVSFNTIQSLGNSPFPLLPLKNKNDLHLTTHFKVREHFEVSTNSRSSRSATTR